MDGSDKEPLIPPFLGTNDKFPNWNVLPKGQYRFIFNDPSFMLDCKYTKFADSVFKDAQTLVAQCGPNKQYRFTVKDLEGRVLDSEVENTRFGCSACPVGFDYMVGFTDIQSFNDLGEYNSVQNEAQCNELCQERGCKSFIFSFNHKKCKLAKHHFTKMEYSNFEDYNVCTKQPYCCSTLEMSSTGATQTFQGARLGTYQKTGDKYNNRDIYKQQGGSNIMYFRGEEDYGWVISSGLSSKGGLRSSFDFECPSDAIQWVYYFYEDNIWNKDEGVQVSCSTVCQQNKRTDRCGKWKKACLLNLPFFDVRTYTTGDHTGVRGSASLRWGIQSGGFEDATIDTDAKYCIAGNTQAEYSTNSCKNDEKYLFNKYAAGLTNPNGEQLTVVNAVPKFITKLQEYNHALNVHITNNNRNLQQPEKQDHYYHHFKDSDSFWLEYPPIPNDHLSQYNRNDLSLKDLENQNMQYAGDFLRDCKTRPQGPRAPQHFIYSCGGKDVGSKNRLCMTNENNHFSENDKVSISKQQSTDQMKIQKKDYEKESTFNKEIKLTIDTAHVGWTGKLLKTAEVKRIKEMIPKGVHGNARKCGLTRAQFAKGRGAFGDSIHVDTNNNNIETLVRGDQSNGLAEKHFILDQKSHADNLNAANELSKFRRYPENMNPQINTVFVVPSSFTNENISPNTVSLPASSNVLYYCNLFGCLLDYSKLDVYRTYTGPDGFELLGFKGLPSVRTKTIRQIDHKRAINSFCIMDKFVVTYQCERTRPTPPATNSDFNCVRMTVDGKEAQCVGVIDDALDSIGHLYGAFCKQN